MTHSTSRTAQRSRAGIALWIAFLAGAGVLATGLVALWLALQSSERRMAEQARDVAKAQAEAVRAVMRNQGFVRSLPERALFAFDDQVVTVPDTVGWVIEPPAEVELRPGVLELLEQVELLEFDGESEAGATLQRAIQGLGSATAEAFAVRVRQAWWWHRRERPDDVEAALRELLGWLERAERGEEPNENTAPAPEVDVRTQDWVGVLLLALEHARAASLRHAADEPAQPVDPAPWSVPGWAAKRMRWMPSDRALALLASIRLRADAGTQPQLDALRVEVQNIAERRARLKVASVRHRDFVGATAGLVLPAESHVILVPAVGEGGSRVGAVLRWSELGAALRSASGRIPGLVTWRPGDLVVVDAPAHASPEPLPDGFEPIVDGRLGVRVANTAGELASGPVWLAGLLITLGVLCAAGLAAAFKALRREAAATAVRADFMVSVTHELKTPLASIRLLSEMLERGSVKDPERRQEYHRLLAGESMRLNGLIENVLDLGRIERGERGFDRREQQLDPVVEEVLALFGPVAAREGIEVNVELGAPAAIGAVDRGALTQVIWNLVDNARKYAAAGRRLDVASSIEGQRWRLRVRDYGPGITASERASVFEAFERADTHRDGSVPGVGLGLYLSRSIAKSHGGELRVVDVEAGEPAGACFELNLPETQASGAVETT